MRTASPEVIAALATDHIEANAIRVSLPNGGAVYRYSNWPDGVTIGGDPYPAAAGLAVISAPRYADAALSEVTVQVPDPTLELEAAQQSKQLIGTWVELFDLVAGVGGALESVPAFAGGVEEVTGVRLGFVGLRVGPAAPIWRMRIPPVFSPRCHYRNATLDAEAKGQGCRFAATCARTWAACGANGKQSIFGGDTHLCPNGYLIEFRDSSGSVGSSNGGNRGVVVIP